MATTGENPPTILLAWEVLRMKASEGPGLGCKKVYKPLELLQCIPVAYSTAGQILTRLERAGYIKKDTHGTRRLISVDLLKTGPLGEDILGKQNDEQPAQKPKPQIDIRSTRYKINANTRNDTRTC